MIRRLIAILLSGAMFLSSFCLVNANANKTIPEVPSVFTTEHMAYITGREGNQIEPYALITRAEVAAILSRLLREEFRNVNHGSVQRFADVREDQWFFEPVMLMVNLGIINGRTETEFSPDAPVTRAELAAIAARFAEEEAKEKVQFADMENHWAKPYVEKVVDFGWMDGYGRVFYPDNRLIRAEVITTINRMLKREPETVADILPQDMLRFKDNSDTKAWYYLAIQEAANSHTHVMKEDGVHETWGKVLSVVPPVTLQNAARYQQATELTDQMVRKAMDDAVEKLRRNIPKWETKFPTAYSNNGQYGVSGGINWTSGMLTGCYWLAYEYTKDSAFREAALQHTKQFQTFAQNANNLNDHDTGFIYTPSCVAGYKIMKNDALQKTAISAAETLLTHYDWENNFIIRSGYRNVSNYNGYRTLVDSMMNIPLFFFAYQETAEQQFYQAAMEHYRTTMQYLIRNDGSSYHHYQFDPATGAPVGGVTHQGNSNESCWSRGHSWLLYGFPIAYSYTKDKEIIDVYKKVAYFYLNNLPSDNIPYWDFDFNEGSSEPRDASAAAITVCGFLEMCKWLPEGSADKIYFKNAADAQMRALITNCADTSVGNGLIGKVSHAVPQKSGILEYAVYGDYFYMEALMRYLNPDWQRYW